MDKKPLYSTQAEYEVWLAENFDKAIVYFKDNDVFIKDIEFSARAYNALRLNGKNKISEILFNSEEEISSWDMVNSAVADEIFMLRRNYLRKHKRAVTQYIIGVSQETTLPEPSHREKTPEIPAKPIAKPLDDTSKIQNLFASKKELADISCFLSNESNKLEIRKHLESQKDKIEILNLSARAFHSLKRKNISFIYETLDYYPDKFLTFPQMGQKSVDELCSKIKAYIVQYLKNANWVFEAEDKSNSQSENNPLNLTLIQLLSHPQFKEKALEYMETNDLPVEEMGLQNRSARALKLAGINSFLQSLSIYPNNISQLKNIGAKSVADIKERIDYFSRKFQPSVSAFCNGEKSLLYSDEQISDFVKSCFDNIAFNGVSFSTIRATCPAAIEDSRIKKCIGKMLAEKELEYVDFRLYKIYPSIFTILENTLIEPHIKEIILRRFNGDTLEIIAQDYNITRERVRQIITKNLKKIRIQLSNQYGYSLFDEDYYAHLYNNYGVTKELWIDFLGVSQNIFGYLSTMYPKGTKNIEHALTDPEIDLILKFKIQDYLNRHKILIDGVLVEKQRSEIEDFAIAKLCRDEITHNEFAEKYNEMLRKNHIPYDEKLYYNDYTGRSRLNKIAESKICLYKNGERIRYYDILEHDYTELLETLNLENFRNTEISTLKFFNDYREIMEKYDIRDQYELHNLLKKIVVPDKYHDISFHRQPMICFGEFDRTKAIYDIIVALSPVTMEELTEYVHLEYGYDRGSAMGTYFQPFNHLYHNGVFSVEFKPIPSERVEILKAHLPEEFYYISEVKKIYADLFDGADTDEISHRSLKSIGFSAFNKYILKTYRTAEAYFRDILLKEDLFSLDEISKKYSGLQIYYSTLYDMYRNYDILQFEKGQIINFNRLEKLGITKNDIKEYCNRVYEEIDDNTYFTVYSLKKYDIVSKLDELGFDECFFAGILAMSTKFLYAQAFGKTVFYKGQRSEGISKKSFILSMLSNYDSVEIDELIDDCFDEYGIEITERYEIANAVTGTEYYYDRIMNKVYRNKDYYYADLDD